MRTIAIRDPSQSEKRTIAIHIQRGNWGRKWGAGGTPAELKRANDGASAPTKRVCVMQVIKTEAEDEDTS